MGTVLLLRNQSGSKRTVPVLLPSTIVSATVTAPTALEADVLAKVTLLSGEADGKALIFSKKSNAVIINDAKEIWRGGE